MNAHALIEPVLLLVLVVAMLCIVAAAISHSLKLLGKIQIILALLPFVGGTVYVGMVLWLHSMAYTDPVRQWWAPRLFMICSIFWFGSIILLFIFTVCHVIVMMIREPRTRNAI